MLVLAANSVLLAIETKLPALEQASELPTAIGRAVFHLLIWGSYMVNSQRVKATFTRRRGSHSPPPPPSVIPSRIGPPTIGLPPLAPPP